MTPDEAWVRLCAIRIAEAVQACFSVGNFQNTVGSDWMFATTEEIVEEIEETVKDVIEESL